MSYSGAKAAGEEDQAAGRVAVGVAVAVLAPPARVAPREASHPATVVGDITAAVQRQHIAPAHGHLAELHPTSSVPAL